MRRRGILLAKLPKSAEKAEYKPRSRVLAFPVSLCNECTITNFGTLTSLLLIRFWRFAR